MKHFCPKGPNLIGSLLAKARRESGKTQTQIAERAGRPQSWLSRVELGHAHRRFDDFVVLARNVDADPVTLCVRYLERLTIREHCARGHWSGS